jgi:hypothetical protein
MTITIRGDFDHLVAHQRLEKLKQWLDVTEKYLGKAKAEFEAKSYEELELNLFPQDVKDEIYSEELWYYGVKFPRVLRNSFLVSTYSLLEYEINVICRRLKKERPILRDWNDSKPDKLEEAKLYWKDAGLDISYNSTIWENIKRYSRIRNCIVHMNGLTKEFKDKDRKSLIPYLEEKGIISEDTIDEEIALTAKFCKEVIKTMQYFLNDVYKAISTARKKLKSDNKKQGV